MPVHAPYSVIRPYGAQDIHQSMGSAHIAYDRTFWDAYADSNHTRYDAEFANRIIHTAEELRCASILEVGCGTGIDLGLFLPDKTRVYGLDPNYRALARARRDIPHGTFVRGMITHMPFADMSIDIIFTHRLLNYLDDATIQCGMREMYRVAKKHVVSCEWFSESEHIMDKRRMTRNMAKRWNASGAHVVADIPVYCSAAARHHDNTHQSRDKTSTQEPDTRLTLVSK